MKRVIVVAVVLAACSEQRTENVSDDAGVDVAQGADTQNPDTQVPDSGPDGSSFTYCEDGVLHTGVCNEGICDPAPFEICDDGSCVLSPASCKQPPTKPVYVTIKNERSETIYIDGLFVPFGLRDGAGENIATHTMTPSCDACSGICDNTLPHGDPLPCYVEIAPGAKVEVAWSGITYHNETCTPTCEKVCSKSALLAPGSYTVVVPYRLELDPAYTFTETECSSIEGGVKWAGDGIGTCVFDQQAETKLTFGTQGDLLLVID